MWSVYAAACYSATRKKEIPPFMATWMKGIVLSETATPRKRNTRIKSGKSKLTEQNDACQWLSAWESGRCRSKDTASSFTIGESQEWW